MGQPSHRGFADQAQFQKRQPNRHLKRAVPRTRRRDQRPINESALLDWQREMGENGGGVTVGRPACRALITTAEGGT